MQTLNPVKSDIQFPSLEESILKHWKENKLIEKGLEATKSNIQNLVAEMDRIWRWYAEGLATPLEDL